MKTNFDYNKEQYRGTLKQIMKVRGLRSISIANYNNWVSNNGGNAVDTNIHSLKLDIQDGYINAYSYGVNGKCGERIEDTDANSYRIALNIVNDILSRENTIPYKVKRNIFVKMCR